MSLPIQSKPWYQEHFLSRPYRVHALLYLLFIAQGIFYCQPGEILSGLRGILTAPDILVTDYIAVGGLGPTLINVGLVGLVSLLVLAASRDEPRGLTMGTLGLATGFAFFGKNPLNMAPILLGGYLYSRYAKLPFRRCVIPTILGTCLSPAVTQLAHVPTVPLGLAVVCGLGIGLGIGFIMSPLAEALRKAHEGFNLYNVGFAAGILGLGLYAVFQVLGIRFATQNLWSNGHNRELSLFLAILSLYLILCGLLCKGVRISFFEIITISAEDDDHYRKYAEKSYIAMGIMGLACLALMFLVDGEYSGPVLGSILSVVGFGAYGKALPSAAPVVSGALLAAVISMFSTGVPYNQGSFLTAAFFSTCLSPLAKHFGPGWGILAGFLHLSLAVNVTVFHGGMNLYNNGFAGGLAAMLLLPIIRLFRENP